MTKLEFRFLKCLILLQTLGLLSIQTKQAKILHKYMYKDNIFYSQKEIQNKFV